MALAQRFFKISGQCFLMDADNTLLAPSAKEFVLTHSFQNEEYEYDNYGFNKFTHPRKGSWSGQITQADSSFDDAWFAARVAGTRASATASVAFVEMEEGTVAGGNTITLAYTPAADETVQVFDPDTRADYVQGAATASPNVYSISSNVITMPAAVGVGEIFRVNYFRSAATAAKTTFSPYDLPSAFKLYAAQAVAWAADGTKYWAVVYARSCVPTGDVKVSGGDVTLGFNVNNVVTDDLIIYRELVASG